MPSRTNTDDHQEVPSSMAPVFPGLGEMVYIDRNFNHLILILSEDFRGMKTVTAKHLVLLTLVMLLSAAHPTAKAADRQWRDGKIMSIDQTEQPIILSPTRERKDSTDNNGNYTSTTTVTGGPTGRSRKTYWYTITDGTKYYVAKITANMFNVTTPAKVDVGDAKFTVDGKNLILKGSDGKEYKTEIVKTSLTPPTQPG
jgi:hypothetical protein